MKTTKMKSFGVPMFVNIHSDLSLIKACPLLLSSPPGFLMKCLGLNLCAVRASAVNAQNRKSKIKNRK